MLQTKLLQPPCLDLCVGLPIIHIFDLSDVFFIPFNKFNVHRFVHVKVVSCWLDGRFVLREVVLFAQPWTGCQRVNWRGCKVGSLTTGSHKFKWFFHRTHATKAMT